MWSSPSFERGRERCRRLPSSQRRVTLRGHQMVNRALFSTAVAALALAGCSASVFAADLRVKAPVYKAPPPVAVYDWTGCYAGGSAGWIGGGDQFDLTPSGAFDLPANVFSIPANRAPLLSSY